MSSSEVVRLDHYRNRRAERLRTAIALARWRPDRRIRVEGMAKALEVSGADRALTVAVDDLGEGAVRVDHVVDLRANPPRRTVSRDLLQLAARQAVPGLGDLPDRPRAGVLFFPEAPSSAAVVTLGSDGSRSWFLVIDSITPRGRLTEGQRESLMFIGGELASVVLDRDAARLPLEDSFENVRSESFAGWGVLGDLADGTVSDEQRDRVNLRFLTARVLNCHLEEGLARNRVGLADQTAQVRGELLRLQDHSQESLQTLALLDSLERGGLPDLSERVLDHARTLEAVGHLHGAREFYLSAYEVAAQCQAVDIAIDAAWGLGRASRRAADWPGAFRWYGIARELSGTLEVWDRHGRVPDGLANALRDRGNLPLARETLVMAQDVSERTGDEELRASVMHTFMTVEKLAGEHDLAIVYGWGAVRRQQDAERRHWALMDLGGVFLESGRYAAAENAFRIVAAAVEERDALVLARNGLAMVSAYEQKPEEFERRCADVETAGWQNASAIVRGQILLDRGLSWSALGDHGRAREWLQLALAFGETQGVGKLILDAEQALSELQSTTVPDGPRNPAIPECRDRRVEEVCQELATMCGALETAY